MFSKDFMFGVSTASYQIEGSIDADGKVESIWDRFTKVKGNIIDSTDGSKVCESYVKYKDDVRLIKELGVSHYRFSIAWGRVVDSNNMPNIKGIEYYKNLCKELISNNIIPVVTLYHWDMPSWIEDKGGFLNDEIVEYFKNYTDIVTKGLDGLVKDYITINEPQCIMFLGHRLCSHAPGVKYDDKDMLHAIHNLLKCHGIACRVIRKNVKNSTIGIAPCSRPMVPVDTNNELLYKKCYDKYFELDRDNEYPNNVSIYSDPIFLGDYPKEYYEKFSKILPNITKEDLKLISEPIDYLYQNIYTGTYYKLDENNNLVKVEFSKDYPTANIDWLQIVPKAMYYGPKYLYERYKKPIIISENGYCNNDFISPDGNAHDIERIDYLRKYIKELENVSKEIEVKGYFLWSLFDNFEWSYGLSKRFGLVYIDYDNGNRIKKDSYFEYKNIVKNGGV